VVEKEQLSSILNLIESKDDKLLKKFRLRIILAVIIMFFLAMFVLFAPNLIGIHMQQFSFMIFFFFGIAVARWDSLNKLKRLLPHFNAQSIKKRLGEIDT
jgi:hypothetical protein